MKVKRKRKSPSTSTKEKKAHAMSVSKLLQPSTENCKRDCGATNLQMDVRSERGGGCAIDDVVDGMLSNTNVYRWCKYKIVGSD